MWLRDENLLQLIEKWWNDTNGIGSKTFKIVTKLKKIKQQLTRWNREHFGNIFSQKIEIEKEMEIINEEVIKYGMNDLLYQQEKSNLARYEEILAREEIFWKQKSRDNWLDVGDRNTSFFHNSTKHRRALNRINKIKLASGDFTDNPEIIAKTIVGYFETILNNWEGSKWAKESEFLKNILKLILEENNLMLNKKLTKEEVELALFQMGPDKALSPDGFPALFYQKCWSFMGGEIIEALEGMRNSGKILRELNNTFITLIPKKEVVESFEDFRPIALCNTLYKLLTKTMANRLITLLPIVISEEQTRFVPNRSIYDGIIIA